VWLVIHIYTPNVVYIIVDMRKKYNIDGLEIYSNYKRGWSVQKRILVATIILICLLGAGMAEKYFLSI